MVNLLVCRFTVLLVTRYSFYIFLAHLDCVSSFRTATGDLSLGQSISYQEQEKGDWLSVLIDRLVCITSYLRHLLPGGEYTLSLR